MFCYENRTFSLELPPHLPHILLLHRHLWCHAVHSHHFSTKCRPHLKKCPDTFGIRKNHFASAFAFSGTHLLQCSDPVNKWLGDIYVEAGCSACACVVLGERGSDHRPNREVSRVSLRADRRALQGIALPEYDEHIVVFVSEISSRTLIIIFHKPVSEQRLVCFHFWGTLKELSTVPEISRQWR